MILNRKQVDYACGQEPPTKIGYVPSLPLFYLRCEFAPAANAGSDQTVTDNDGNGSENVTLDGTGSTDTDGTIASYVWSEGGNQIGNGANPTVSLNVGTHTITLTVTDNDGGTGTDTMTVTVNPKP